MKHHDGEGVSEGRQVADPVLAVPFTERQRSKARLLVGCDRGAGKCLVGEKVEEGREDGDAESRRK